MATSSRTCKFRVAICGGGVGGLTLAYALSRSPDIQVDVYEASTKFSEVGAGIGVWRRTWQILKTLGLEHDLLQLLDRRPSDDIVPTLQYRKADQPEGQSFSNLHSRGGLLTFHRAEFHSVLLQRLSSRCKTFNSKRLHHYVQPPHAGAPIQLVFQDGTTATCDLVIGADGIKSVVRRTMLNEQALQLEQRGQANEAADLRDRVEPRFSGVLVHRTLIPADKLRQIAPQNRALSVPTQFLGRNRHIMAYPISHGRYINFVDFEADYSREGSLYTDPWISTVDSRALSKSFTNWELDVRQLASCLDGLTVNRWAVNVMKPLNTFSHGKVVLLGDAAHAMTPFQGAGAGQAIEDAFILSSLLSHPLTTLRTLPQVLSIYSRVRVPFANKIADRSRRNGLDFALNGYHDTGDGAGLTELGERIRKNFEWAWASDAGVELRQATEMLEREVGGRR